MPQHSIRLRGPWQLSLVDRGEEGVIGRLWPVGRFMAPRGLTDCLPADHRGWIRLERSFHRPTGLTDLSRVQLWFETNLSGQLAVNDQGMGPVTGGENVFDVTAVLRTRNRIYLDLLIDASGSISQPSCDVRLEIFD